MAYIRESKTAGDTEASTSFTPDEMKSFVDDYILLLVVADLSSGGDIAIPTGYTEAISQVSNTTTMACFYKKVTVQNEPIPEISKPALNSTPWIVSAYIIADADNTFVNAIATSITTVGSQISIPSPQVTTTSKNCLIIRFATCQNGVMFTESTGVGSVIFESYSKGASTIYSNYNNQPEIGASKSITHNKRGNGRTSSLTIAINNITGGELECDLSDGIQYIQQHGINQLTAVGGADIVTSGIVPTTILGEPYTSVPTAVSTAENDEKTSTVTRVTQSSVPANDWFGFSVEMPTTNLLGVLTTITVGTQSGLWKNRFLFYFEDSLGNYSLFPHPLDSDITRVEDWSILTPVQSSPTLIDWTSISKYGIITKKRNTSTSNRNVDFKDFAIVDNDNAITLFGGNVTARKIAKAMRTGGDLDRSLSQGLSQDVLTVPFKIGNGVNKTLFKHQGASIETPSNLVGWNPLPNVIDFTVHASPDCDIDFSSGILANTIEQNFKIHPASSLLATYNFATIFNNFRITWLKGIECKGATFLNSGLIDTNGSDFVNCSFSQATEPRGVLLYDNGNITNSSFTKGFDDYAIEINEAGAYDLSDTTFTGYTTDINVTATTGVVDITLESGQATPTYITAGATVNFLQPQNTLTLTNIKNPTKVYLVDTDLPETDSSFILDSELVTSGVYSYSFAPSQNINALYRLISLNYKAIEQDIFLSNTDLTIPISQQIDREYENN